MRPNARSTPQRRLRGAFCLGALLAGVLAYVGVADPHRIGSVFPPCPFRLLTGWNCPACGGLRMVHDLLHGDLAAAVTDNVFLLVGIPALAAWILLRRHRAEPVLPLPVVVVVAAAAVLWAVLRNLPGFPLAPTVFAG